MCPAVLQTTELKGSQCGRTRNLHVIYLPLSGKHGAFILPIHVQECDVKTQQNKKLLVPWPHPQRVAGSIPSQEHVSGLQFHRVI